MAKLRYNARVYEDTAANLATDPTVYGPNDLVFATDTGELKRGNGTDAYSDLLAIGGNDGEPASVAWADVTGKPSTFAPTIGTTATTAKAGNYAPAWADVTGKPATFAPTIGTTAATAAAGNHTHSNYATTADLSALEARVAALEGAGG